jgi:hypothetical protein
MPKKRPPNAEATEFRSGEQAVENGRKGGVNSGIARREKKTVQKILNDFLSTAAKDNPQVSKLAAKIGLKSDDSIKDLFTIACTLNTLKNGELKDLELMMKLLGETPQSESSEAAQQAEFLDVLKKAVSNEDQ